MALNPSTPPTIPPSVPQTCLQRHTAPRPPGPAPSWQTRPWLGSQTWRWSQDSPSRRARTRQQLQPSSTRGTPRGHRGGGQGQAHGVGHSWAHTCRDRDLAQLWSFTVGSETLTIGHLSVRLGSVRSIHWSQSLPDLTLSPGGPLTLPKRWHGIVVISIDSGLRF